MSSEPTGAWSASRRTTNPLLGAILVVLAAGFIVVGRVGPRTIQAFSELLLVLVPFAAVALVLRRLVRTE